MLVVSAAALMHVHRNFSAILEAMATNASAFAKRCGMPRRALAYRFNPLREKRVRGTSIESLSRIARAAGCSVSMLHITPDDAALFLGARYPVDPDLHEQDPVRVASRVASALRHAGAPASAMVVPTILGTALGSRQAAFDAVERLRALDRL